MKVLIQLNSQTEMFVQQNLIFYLLFFAVYND